MVDSTYGVMWTHSHRMSLTSGLIMTNLFQLPMDPLSITDMPILYSKKPNRGTLKLWLPYLVHLHVKLRTLQVREDRKLHQ